MITVTEIKKDNSGYYGKWKKDSLEDFKYKVDGLVTVKEKDYSQFSEKNKNIDIIEQPKKPFTETVKITPTVSNTINK